VLTTFYHAYVLLVAAIDELRKPRGDMHGSTSLLYLIQTRFYLVKTMFYLVWARFHLVQTKCYFV